MVKKERQVGITVRRARGDAEEILEWFSKLPKDEDYADLLDEAVEKMRKGLKLG